jgi:hypothetical protein
MTARKDLRQFYRMMNGKPQIIIPPPRFRDESFRLHGRQIPRTKNYYWGVR